MLKFTITSSKNPNVVAQKTLEEMKKLIIDGYKERTNKSLGKDFIIVATLKGSKLVFDITVGKGALRNQLRNYTSEDNFRNVSTEDEFRNVSGPSDKNILLDVVRDAIKQLPSIVRRLDTEEQ